MIVRYVVIRARGAL